MQKYVTFIETEFYKSSINIKIIEKKRDHCHYTSKHGGAAQNICT